MDIAAKEIIFHVYLNVPGIFSDVLFWGQTRGRVIACLHALAQRTIFFAAIFLSHLRYLLTAFCLAGLLGPRCSYLLAVASSLKLDDAKTWLGWYVEWAVVRRVVASGEDGE